MATTPRFHAIEMVQSVPDRKKDGDCHPIHEIIAILGGTYEAMAQGKRVTAETGDIVCYPANLSHMPLLGTDGAVRFYVLQWEDDGGDLSADRRLKVRDTQGRMLVTLNWMWQLYPARDKEDRRMLDRLLQVFLGEHRRLSRSLEEDDESADGAIAEAIHYLERDFYRALNVEEVSRVAGLSVPHFIRRFRKATGRTPGRFLQDMRIAAAINLLSSTKLTREEISRRVGFNSVSHLHALVRRSTGRTLDELRRSAK